MWLPVKSKASTREGFIPFPGGTSSEVPALTVEENRGRGPSTSPGHGGLDWQGTGAATDRAVLGLGPRWWEALRRLMEGNCRTLRAGQLE